MTARYDPMRQAQPLVMAIDVGGTFTDVAILDEEGRAARFEKTSTTPEDPARGVITAMDTSSTGTSELKGVRGLDSGAGRIKRSAQRPGAMPPSRWSRPYRVATLRVAIRMACAAGKPQSTAFWTAASR